MGFLGILSAMSKPSLLPRLNRYSQRSRGFSTHFYSIEPDLTIDIRVISTAMKVEYSVM